MGSEKKISVIMPVYNTKEEFLREAIESILNQTFSDFEFIIVNDGSTNNAEEVILSYKDDRIVYIKQENQGVSIASNNGIERANGEYIARMDSDDVSLPDRFEKQIKFLEDNPEYSLVGTWARILGTKKIIKFPEDVKLIDLLADCTFVHSTIMYRKSDIDRYNLRYTAGAKLAEDYMFYAKAIKYLKMTNLQEVLLEYRVYPDNTSSSKKDELVQNSFIVQDFILDFITNDTKIRKKILDLAYKKKSKTSNLKEKIFSIKNLYKNWAKYKLITILGFEICVKSKEYKRGVSNA